jgi:deazaflavin-dependent oxidoreductase (nitroreductase family)
VARRDLKWWEKLQEGFARSRPGGWFAVNVANPIDRRLLRWTGARVGLFLGQPVGLLETVGARSGQARTTPLLYMEDGDRVILVASKSGSVRHPAWYHNLRAHPEVGFAARGGGYGRYRAREAEGDERAALWAKANDLYAGYDDYQGRAGGRRIPVIVLERQAAR